MKISNKTMPRTSTLITRRIAGITFAAMLGGLIAAPLPALAQTPASGSSTTTTAKPKRAPTPGQLAAQERMKKCAAEWKGAKAAGKVEKGETWPKYWSACNKRLKTAG